jgi:hypothetical protein
MLTLGGPEIEMAGGAMVKEKAVVEVSFPELPVMVNLVVPSATELLAERVKYTYWAFELVGLAGFEEKEALTPVGSPEIERLMGPVNPF